MAAKQADMEIQIPDDDPPPVEAEIVVEDAEKTPEAPVSVEEGIDDLKKKLEQAESARLQAESARRAAEQRAASAETAVVGARNETADANLNLLANAVAATRQQMEVFKRNYAEAMANGDFSAAGDAQEQMALAGAKVVRLEEGLQAYKNRPKEEPRRIVDPVENLASQMDREGSPRSARWIRTHPEYATDPRLMQRMVAAHNLAITDGITPDTDAYFASVESTLGLRREAEPTEPATQGRRASPPAAPVSRGANGNGSTPRSVRLTQDQLEIAAMTGLTPEEYAQNLMRSERERMN